MSRLLVLSIALRSIKTRITLGAVAALTLGIGLTTVLLVSQAERDTLAGARQRELQEASRSAGLLSRRVVELQRALSATAEDIDAELLTDPQALEAFFRTRTVLRGMFTHVLIADTHGQILAMANSEGMKTPNVNIADRPYFQQTLAQQRAIVSEPVTSRVTAQPVILFTYPLVRAGRPLGVLGGSVRLNSRDLLADLVDTAEELDSLTIISDSRGRIIAHPDRQRIMQSMTTEARMSEGFSDWLGAGASLEPAGLLLEQSGQVVTMAAVAGPDWVVWRALPEVELLAPLHKARQQAMVWAGAIVTVGSIYILALIAWLLRPLSLLKQRAMNLFDAQRDADEGWPQAQGEIGDLTRVLRHVAAERTQLERFNADVLGKLASVMAAAPMGIMFTRGQRFELVSRELCRLFGRSEAGFLGQHATSIFASRDDYAALVPQVVAAFAANAPYVGEWRMLRSDGSSFWGRLRGQSVEHGNPDAGTIWTLDDVSDQIAAREELEWSAGHDALTGLPNRKRFEQCVNQTLQARPASLPAAVVMIDLDRFKPINDAAGHAAGDAMLQAVAAAITSNVRASDLAARLGGDEFALLLPRCPALAAERIAGEVRQAISDIVLPWQGRHLSVGASLGVSLLTADTADAAAWLADADAACYAAKAAGRNLVSLAHRPQQLRRVRDAV